MIFRGLISRLVMSLVMILFLSGCAGDEEKKAGHWEKAREYMERGELDSAIIELKNVIKIDAWDDRARYELGEIYMAKNDLPEAYRSFWGTLTADSENLEARLRIGQILLLAHKTRDARDMAREILKRSPHHMEASILLARVLVQEGEPGAAVEVLEGAIPWHPNHVPAWLTLGDLQLRLGDLEEAERAYLHAVFLDKSLEGLVVEGGPYKVAPVLARYYEVCGEWGRAEDMYDKMIKAYPGGRTQAVMGLADFYARRGMYDKALETMERAAEEREEDLDIMVQIARLHLDYGYLGKAEEAADRVLGYYEGHLGARLIKGRILLEKEDYDGALGHLEAVIQETPGRSAPHYLKGVALLGKGEIEAAQGALIRALELDPRLLDARMHLAKIYLRREEKGSLSLAREQLERILEAAPDNTEALVLYGNLKIKEHDLFRAEEAFKRVVEKRPEDPVSHFRLGMVYHLMGKNRDAIGELKKALSLDPDDLNTVGLLVDLYIRTGSPDEALRLCQEKRSEEAPPKENAVFEQLLGKVFLSKGDMDRAERHFKKAVEYDPGLMPAHRALTELYSRGGRTDEIISHYQAMIEADKGFLPGYVTLGLIHDERGEEKKAEEYYRKALEIKPGFGPAANNLAVILAERGENLEEALRLSRAARDEMPDDPFVMDTLGWIYHLLGHHWKAVPELERAVERMPEKAVFRYHLGKACYANKDLQKAKLHLSKALELAPASEHAPEARVLVTKIEEEAAAAEETAERG